LRQRPCQECRSPPFLPQLSPILEVVVGSSLLRGWLVAALILTALLIPLRASPGSGQTLVGQLLDQATGDAVAAAFVVLTEPDGRPLGAALTGADGRFVLRARAGGRYGVVAEMVGRETPPVQWVELRAQEVVDMAFRVLVRPVSLQGVGADRAGADRVGAEGADADPAGTDRTGVCLPLGEAGSGAARLWEEARKALSVVAWAEAVGALELAGVQYRRVLGPGSLQVLESAEAAWRGGSTAPSDAAISVEQLAATGYVHEDDDGYLVYHTPSPHVLLSDSFRDGHCFTVAEAGPDDPGLLGLAFEPVGPDDARVGIRGVLWLDQATAELVRLDYSYTHLPGMPADVWGEAGGRVELERLDTGAWIVRRWRLHMPEIEVRPGSGRRAPEAELVAIHETGGEVRVAAMADGRSVGLRTLGAVLRGVVRDGATDRPLAGARVTLLGTGRETRTDADGVFRLGDLVAGVFEVGIQHPDAELEDLAMEVQQVTVGAGRTRELSVVLRPVAELMAEVCAGAGSLSDDGIPPVVLVHGKVVTRGGSPAPEAVVRIVGGPLQGGESRHVVTDEAGEYRACLQQAAAPASVSAFRVDGLLRRSAGDVKQISAARPGVVRADLMLAGRVAESAIAAESAVVTGPWENTIVGTVVDDDARTPVAGALVRLLDDTGQPVRSTVTDADGRFRFAHPDRGDVYRLTVEHLGYATADGTLTFDRHTQLRLGVALSTRPIELDPIVVTERRPTALTHVGFYDRRARGFGTFVEVDDALRGRASRSTDLLRGQPFIGIRQVNTFGDEDVTLGTGCAPAIYLDGALVRPGGPQRGGGVTLSQIVSPDAVAAIEVFRRASQIPARWGGASAGCGVIVVWTR
jgi:hypothetical protein